jgi:hypothetical protein
MPTPSLNDTQLRAVLSQAGFTGEALNTAVRIARAESGGNPKRINNNTKTKDLSYGLFQVNMIGDLGPARRKQFGLKNNSDLLDPLTNARVAFTLSNQGTMWYPWTNTAKKLGISLAGDSYAKTGGAGAPVGVSVTSPGADVPADWKWWWEWHPGGGPSVQDLVPKAVDPLGLTDAASSLSGFLKILKSGDWWLRFGEMTLGVVAIVWGLLMLAGKTQAGQQIIKQGIRAAKVAV